MNSASFEELFDSLVRENETLIEGTGNNSQSKWAGLKVLLREALGVDRIHTFKLRSNSVDNCLWEGSPLFERYELGLAFVPTPIRQSRPYILDQFPDAAANRLFPGPNGFDAIGICIQDGDTWTISHVVAERGSVIAARIRSRFPNSLLHEVARPSSPSPTSAEAGSAEDASELVRVIAAHAQEAHNIVLQGPPGTGKTYLAHETVAHLGHVLPSHLNDYRFESLLGLAGGDFASLLAGDDAASLIWEIVQLHPNYSYDDLVRGMSTVEQAGRIGFAPQDRLLVQLAALAVARPKTTVVLVLDEINRANLASVFGELIFAIEPGSRGVPVRLQYPAAPGSATGDVLALPINLKIIGTMNTADRSISLVDYAVRRRFRFLDIRPDRRVVARHYPDTRRSALAVAMFDAVASAVDDPNLRIGHSYFLVPHDANDWAERLADRFMLEILPLLREYAAEDRAVPPTIAFGGVSFALDASPREQEETRRRLVEILAHDTDT